MEEPAKILDDADRIALIQEPLLSWYAQNARDLPWRRHPSAYQVWVSEIMLQQTRVEAVRPYYTRFLTALPSIAQLAVCPEDRLLKLWEGLGYYSRVRNMQRCAKAVMEKYAGELPADEALLRKLPGIGPYTAGAIASIAFGLPVPAVDGNVCRVISRITASTDDILLTDTHRQIEENLRKIMPEKCPGEFNQALMDLGAMVCLPSSGAAGRSKTGARCDICPLRAQCLSFQKGLTDRIPVRIVKTRRRQEKRTILVIEDGERIVLKKRANQGLLAGLYELPGLEGTCSEKEVLSYLRGKGICPLQIRPLPEAKHVFTHLDWLMTGFSIRTEDLTETSLTDQPAPGEMFVVKADQAGKRYAVPAAFRAYMQYLSAHS